MSLRINTEKELQALRESGKRLAVVMNLLIEAARPGLSTLELDTLAEAEIKRLGGVPIFKGYATGNSKPFPASACISLNEEVVHGIPRAERILQAGDLLKLDMGLRFNGMVSDMARTIAIGEVTAQARKLLEITQESLERGIAALRDGAKLHDYSQVVQRHVEAAGFSVVRDLVGHGVGRQLHEEPYIPNFIDHSLPNFTFQTGMSMALEPMVNMGAWRVILAPDQWTYVSADGSLSAHFEDTVIVTEDEAEVVTR